MPVTIPERFTNKLRSDVENRAYEEYINGLIRRTRDIFTEKADFFPEYTIHGWPHIQAVLNHADKLIPEVTLKELSGRDIALLIAAVILHDMGMFLEKAGVRKLLTESRSAAKTAKLDKYDWKSEWDRYIREIRRYPEEKLLYHFGISCAIEEPDLVKGEFSDLDLLVVGDFLRRHHHRIAHEIALGAMPGDTDVDVMQVSIDALGNTAFNMKDRKCIGILARSHGMPIRETREYIKWKLGSKHIEKLFYLMAVLRIADALDADERRAPDTRRKLQGIRTPVSVQEWIWNQRITRTDLDWDDAADFKYIEAEPESTTEFVQLEKWLKWIQSELDLSWAVLSECCDTQKYRLSIHRIESNILEEERRESYGEKFITKDARLNANPEMLKLLVAPLYDNDPSCGVRELLQNAVDACNERVHLEGAGYRGEVQIRLDTKAKTMTVTDNGIGMDENVLLNYYLSAGASYRTSEEWYEKFATDRDSNIVRTGRFGVGVLATFLLGNRVEVTTRHMEDDWGYTFEFGLEPKALDIKRPEVAPEIGTTIVVHLKEDALEDLLEDLREDFYHDNNWVDWYRFAEPDVRYWVDNKEYISDMPFIPQGGQEMPGWFELPGTVFEKVQWGYPGKGLYCNGIRIPDGYDKTGFHVGHEQVWGRDEPVIPYPCLSVIDKCGRLQVDLARMSLQGTQLTYQMEHEFNRYMLARVLAADWSSEEAAAELIIDGIIKEDSRYDRDRMFVCSSKGYTILRHCFFDRSSEFPLLVFHINGTADKLALVRMVSKLAPTLPFVLLPTEPRSPRRGSTTIERWSNGSLDRGLPDFLHVPISKVWVADGFDWHIDGFRYYDKMENVSQHSVNDWEKSESANLEKSSGTDYSTVPFDVKYWRNCLCYAISLRNAQPHHISYYSKMEQDHALRQLIESLIPFDDPWIPYDMEERRKKFPKAFEELKYYIDRIIADREKERGAQNA